MNTAQSNDRSERFWRFQWVQGGEILASPDTNQHQLVWTDWVVRLLEPANNGHYPIVRSSNPRDRWSAAHFSTDGRDRMRINWMWSRGAGAKVMSIIGFWPEPDYSLQEAIEAMIVSLQYPALNPDQVKEWHRDLLGQHGYIDPMNTYTFINGDDGNISHETRESIWESNEPLTFDQFWMPDQQIFNNFLSYFSLGSFVEAAYRNRDFFIRFLREHPALDSSICNIIAQTSHTDLVYHEYEQRVIYKAYRLMLENTGVTNGALFR